MNNLAILNVIDTAIANPDTITATLLQHIKDLMTEEDREQAIAAAYARHDVEAAARMLNGGDLE